MTPAGPRWNAAGALELPPLSIAVSNTKPTALPGDVYWLPDSGGAWVGKVGILSASVFPGAEIRMRTKTSTGGFAV